MQSFTLLIQMISVKQKYKCLSQLNCYWCKSSSKFSLLLGQWPCFSLLVHESRKESITMLTRPWTPDPLFFFQYSKRIIQLPASPLWIFKELICPAATFASKLFCWKLAKNYSGKLRFSSCTQSVVYSDFERYPIPYMKQATHLKTSSHWVFLYYHTVQVQTSCDNQ